MIRTTLSILTLTFLTAISACTGDRAQALVTGPSVPAARGTYSVDYTENGNTRIRMEVAHLAEPPKLNALATTYLVWAQPAEENTTPVPLGALKLDKNHKGSIEVMTPQKSFQVFVTAEPTPNASAPSGEKLLWADIGKGAR